MGGILGAIGGFVSSVGNDVVHGGQHLWNTAVNDAKAGFSSRTPYEVIEDIPAPWIERVEKLKTNALHHPLVQRLEPED